MGCLCCKPPAARPRRRPATLGSENPIYETIAFPLRPRAPPPPPPPSPPCPPGAPLPRRRNPPPMPPGGPVLGCRSRFALPDTDEPVWTDGSDAVWNPSYGMVAVAAGDAPPDGDGGDSPDDDDEMHCIVLLNPAVSLTAGEMQDVWTTLKEIIAAGLISGPRIVILHRYNGDFGFTLRHFIVYPPESLTEHAINPLTAAGVLNFAQPMDTVFVKKVHPNTPAYLAGLQEGDRLLAVNGVPVTSIPYSQVVATIQQTPKTLTLQVVPKNYDILQTFFSETAHNPETNQRPQPQQPVVYAPKPASSATGAYPKSKPAHGPPPQPQPATTIVQHQQHQPLSVEGVQEKQESLYSTLQEIVADNVAVTGGAPAKAAQMLPLHADVPKMLSHGPGMVPMVAHHLPVPLPKAGMPPGGAKPYEYDPLKHQQQYMHQQHQQFLQKIALPGGKEGELGEAAGYGAPLADGDNAIMNRMRKSLEQKEEFLRRPPATALQATPAAGHDVQQREFYARPNRLQKSVWPPTQPLSPGFPGADGNKAPAPSTPSTSSNASPTAAVVSPPGPKPPTNAGGGSTTNGVMREHASQLSAIREHFFTGGVGGSLQLPPKSAPPSLAIAPAAITVPAGPSSPTGAATVPLSPHSLHAVSEKAKLFESGRPLSPEGIDRMDLYKSELSRINTKQVVPNVAVRRKEFELKAESTGWRKSIDDKPRSVSSDSESRRTPVRLRSLSVESNATRDSRHSLASSTLQATDAAFDTLEKDKENQHQQQQQQQQQPSAVPPPMPMLRQKPIRDDSYRSAVRNSTGNKGSNGRSDGRGEGSMRAPLPTDLLTGHGSLRTAFWLQGPVPAAAAAHGGGVGGGAGTGDSSSAVSLASDGEPPSRPVPPVRTYAAAHRQQHPLSAADTEQMRKKQLHRNQTMVGLHHLLDAEDGDGPLGDVEMLHRMPPLTSPPFAPLSPLAVASSVTSTSSVPLAHLGALGEHPSGAAGTTPQQQPLPPGGFRPVAGPMRPTTLNLCPGWRTHTLTHTRLRGCGRFLIFFSLATKLIQCQSCFFL
uniref:PDZ domain-containing protein n=1 Tax=Anopheles melas TaxID=34690 RepID=A0A182TZ78_9DIPT